MIAGADALFGEVVGEAICAPVGLGVGQAPVAADERLALGNGVDHPFPEIGQVVLHGSPNLVGGAAGA